MSDKTVTELNDTDLDAAAGAGDSRHKDWIDISTMSPPVHRSSGGSKTGNAETTWKIEEAEK